MDYRQALSGGGIGWEVQPERAAAHLAARFSPLTSRRLPRIVNRIRDFVTPEPFEAGPPPGVWRAEHQTPHRGDHLFDDILVAVTGEKEGWTAVRMAIDVARREEARLTGLHVLTTEERKDPAITRRIEEEFNRRCQEAGIAGRLVVEGGQAADLLCRHSPWVDLIIFRLNHPPPSQKIQRLRSGVRSMIRRCSSPLLAVAESKFNIGSALLAYGPGRKSDEALFVAAYLAGRWKIPLTVATVRREENATASSPTSLERARLYLETHDVQATYVDETGDPARLILLNTEQYSADLIIMGGYESNPLLESLVGSTVDRVLRSTRRPVLICR